MFVKAWTLNLFDNQRYPTLFDRLPGPGIHNRVTGETFENTSGLKGVDALQVVSRWGHLIYSLAGTYESIPLADLYRMTS